MVRYRYSLIPIACCLCAASFAQTTTRASVDSNGAQGNDSSFELPSISSDGRFVAFASDATNLVPGDTNGFSDIFVRDRQSGLTVRASVDSGGAESNFHCRKPSISAD